MKNALGKVTIFLALLALTLIIGGEACASTGDPDFPDGATIWESVSDAIFGGGATLWSFHSCGAIGDLFWWARLVATTQVAGTI